jgi:hypothetical protein
MEVRPSSGHRQAIIKSLYVLVKMSREMLYLKLDTEMILNQSTHVEFI